MSQIKVAQAALEPRKLNLDFCKVTSPIDGLTSRYNLTPGNLVTQDQTVLTTINHRKTATRMRRRNDHRGPSSRRRRGRLDL